VSCISLRPFRILLHHIIDIDYIDININSFLDDSARNIMIPTNELSAATGKGRLSALWLLSALVVLALIGAGGAKLTGAATMVDRLDKVGLGQWFRYFTGLLALAC
jgi:hypothetical protein